jgi:PDZ domain
VGKNNKQGSTARRLRFEVSTEDSQPDTQPEAQLNSGSEAPPEPLTEPAPEPPAPQAEPRPEAVKSSAQFQVPAGLMIGLLLMLICTVVVALPLLLTKEEAVKTDPNSLGITGLHFAFLNEEFPVITRVDQDSPAYISGIAKDDQIIAVGGQNASLLGDWELSNLLNGPPDAPINVTIKSHETAKTANFTLYRGKATDLPRSEEITYLLKQAGLSRLDSLKDRDAAARDEDYQYTSLIWYHLLKGPVIIEFYDDKGKPNQELAQLVDEHNKAASESHSHITLLSIAAADSKFQPLCEHFNVPATAPPVYVFVAGNRGVISHNNVLRGSPGPRIRVLIAKLVAEGRQPIPDILSNPPLPRDDQTGP